MRKMSMKKNAKKILALGLAAAMVVPATFAADGTTASAETTPTPVKYYDLEHGFRGDGSNGTVCLGKELDVVEVGRWMEFVELLVDGKKPIDKEGQATGEYEKVDTVFVSKSFTSTAEESGYEEVPIPEGAELQKVPDFKTDDGSWQTRGTANQASTAYDEEKGNVFWMGDTMINESYPTYATTVDWENGTYETDENVIVKDTKDSIIEFGINNSATEYVNPLTGSSATGFALSTWVKNTNKYVAPPTYELLGDVNADSNINANDALGILKHVANLELLDDTAVLFADVNGDTIANANDALDILKYVAKLITEFTGETPVIDGGEGEEVKLLDNTQLFHFENRDNGDSEWLKVLDRVPSRGYLYFTADSIVFVKDYTDATKTCTWTLAEELQKDDLSLLNEKNGGKWNYLTYSFDGTDFHMYVNGVERTLVKEAAEGYTTASEDVLAFVKDANTKSYLGGLGGGMKDNFNTFAMNTNEDFYMDDIAVYDVNIDAATAATVYSEADTKMQAEKNRTVTLLKTYALDGATLAENGLTKVGGAKEDADYLPTVEKDVDGRSNVIRTAISSQSLHGGTYFDTNPFAGKDDLTGVTISYWMKAIGNKRGVVTDGVLLSFIDEEKECVHEKVGDAYLGINAMAMSQLYINMAYSADFSEGQTKPIGGNSLKNIYSYRPYTYGDPSVQTDKRLAPLAEDSWNAYKDFLKTLDDQWYFVTITINNAGMTMYLDGEEVENQYMNYAGPRFFDGSWDRIEDAFVNGTNNSGARTLMNFITDETTKIYLGYAYEQGSNSSFLKATNCYIDDISFYSGDMNDEEVKALYDTVK